MHTVAVVAYPGTILFDLATPLEVFGRVALPDGRAGYRVLVCGTSSQVQALGVGLTAPYGLDALDRADTIVVPGASDPLAPVPAELLDALVAAAACGTRIASICVGAFALAATGLLDGARATTHWLAAEAFSAAYPAVELDPSVLFVDNGQLLTSAGAAAGLDLCLHMIRADYGAAVAVAAARQAVVPVQREGGQAQFILTRPAAGSDHAFVDLLAWVEGNAHRDLTLDDIAAQAAMSIRTLNRRFHEQVGVSPMQWLTTTRVRLAQELLETTTHPIERVARQAGFASAVNFRAQFKRAAGVTPQHYRRSFRVLAETG